LPKRSVRSMKRLLKSTSAIRERIHSQIMPEGRNPGLKPGVWLHVFSENILFSSYVIISDVPTRQAAGDSAKVSLKGKPNANFYYSWSTQSTNFTQILFVGDKVPRDSIIHISCITSIIIDIATV